ANDTHLDRQVAIKVMRIDTSRDSYRQAAQEAARLFLREAQAIARLDHPHILPLYASGEKLINGAWHMYMIMPFRHEGSLFEWLHNHGASIILSLWDIERIVRQAASALQHAHNQRIIHQDVKPSNFLVQGNAEQANQLILQLADFGVARFMSRTSDSQIIRGTPDYMAPEQWEGRPVPATDQYALAVMAYELLTGYLPFEGDNHQQMWHQHNFIEPQPPGSINPNIPAEIDDVLLRALSKNPKDRFGSIEIFARAFRQALLQSGNIYQTVTLTPWEARKGTRRVIILPGRRRVTVDVPAGAQNGQVLRLEGMGAPSDYGGPAGALLITIAITEVPEVATTAYISTPDETLPAPNVDEPPPRSRRANIVLKVVSSLLLIALSFGIIFIGLFHLQGTTRTPASPASNATHTTATSNTTPTANTTNTVLAHETNTAQSGDTATAQASNNSATATANAQVVASAQATANANATATAQVNSANATATAYATATHFGTLVLNDPLQDNSQGYNWDISTIPGGGGCAFTQGAYHASMPQTHAFAPCFAQSTNFGDFAYQVQTTIMQGDQAGLIFRADAQNGMFYYFHVNRSGTFALEIINHFNSAGIIASGTSPAIKTGLNQSNLLAVKANGNNLTLYVNMQQVASVSDSTYSQGQIGVIAESIQNPTDVAFSNAKVWERS
ncbi:MAG TPA: protein kinase, partial [Ktedonobacteraceae bacterium]|nr:protein kinase [Ktedonobacteraceae bacterium]